MPETGEAIPIRRINAERVDVIPDDDVYVIEPADREPTAAVVFYLAGHVTADASLEPLASLVTRSNEAVHVVEIPLRFAVLDPDDARSERDGITIPSQLPHPTSLTLTGSLVEGGACP
ncbi:hypothetical protein [Halobaculum gomorrense]|uniref:Uncharacterized protein n=1 Tax=Halobaculum gomorrense TaxID=43928 RepID=A0A1M5NPB2_9EURY|nr:hypothetical protein [Halobaculum gomorrense]SHG91029.1 hypothetical protein SAMN05443636_1291 [Halobaculum gomorrense]